jgi:hypothetical protein
MQPIITTDEQLEAVFKDIQFVNTVLDFKWRFEFKPVRVSYEDNTTPPRTGWFVQVSFERPDTITGEIGRGRGREEIIWRGSTLSSVVKTCWVLVELMIKHESMEAYRWRGARIWNPHTTVEELAALQMTHDKGIK